MFPATVGVAPGTMRNTGLPPLTMTSPSEGLVTRVFVKSMTGLDRLFDTLPTTVCVVGEKPFTKIGFEFDVDV
jgi:hypothetical protein